MTSQTKTGLIKPPEFRFVRLRFLVPITYGLLFEDSKLARRMAKRSLGSFGLWILLSIFLGGIGFTLGGAFLMIWLAIGWTRGLLRGGEAAVHGASGDTLYAILLNSGRVAMAVILWNVITFPLSILAARFIGGDDMLGYIIGYENFTWSLPYLVYKLAAAWLLFVVMAYNFTGFVDRALGVASAEIENRSGGKKYHFKLANYFFVMNLPIIMVSLYMRYLDTIGNAKTASFIVLVFIMPFIFMAVNAAAMSFAYRLLGLDEANRGDGALT